MGRGGWQEEGDGGGVGRGWVGWGRGGVGRGWGKGISKLQAKAGYGYSSTYIKLYQSVCDVVILSDLAFLHQSVTSKYKLCYNVLYRVDSN